MGEPRRIVHPGPVAAERCMAVPCRAVRRAVTLRGGVPLDEALAEVRGAAWIDLAEAPVRRLTFVRPAPAPGDGHAAWYSEPTILEGARIRRAGLHLGRDGTAPFAHVHGTWTDAAGGRHMGHLLCDRTVLARDATATAWRIEGARLERGPDPETRFALFRPVATQPAERPDAVLATLRPNVDLHAGIAGLARQAGLDRARIHGLGSLVGARFDGGPDVETYATEVLLTGGSVAGSDVVLDAVAVGFDGSHGEGPLLPGANAVCVTFELLLTAE